MNKQEKERLIDSLERYVGYYRNSLNEMEENPNKVGSNGVRSPFFPIYYRKSMSWILDGLERTGLYATQFEEQVSKMDEELESYISSHKDEFFNCLYIDLKRLIRKYEEYFKDFQEEKEYFGTSENISPLDKEYFFNRDVGLFFLDGYEFDILISIRTFIEILLEYLDGIYDLNELKNKVQEMDIIFKRDLNDILKILMIEKYYSFAPFSPDRYWWLHIDERQ